jgi:hypothetical protein
MWIGDTLVYVKRNSSFKNKNYTWCCGENALRSARAAIFGTSAGDKSQKRGDKSRQPNHTDLNRQNA